MQFEVWAKGLATLSVDCIVLGVFEEGELPEETHGIDSASNGYLKKLLARGDFSGRTGETLLLAEVPGIEASRALLTGLGAKKSFGRKSWRRSLGAAMTAISKTRIASIAVAIDRPPAKELDWKKEEAAHLKNIRQVTRAIARVRPIRQIVNHAPQ